MRDFFGGLIILSGVFLFVISIVTLIKPLPEIKIGSRKRAGLVMAGSFVLFMIGGSIVPPPSPEVVAAREAEAARTKADREAKSAERKAVQDRKSAAEKKAADEAAAAEAARLKPAMTAAATDLWTRINSTVESCDDVSKTVADAAGRRNISPYTLYPLVESARSICSAESLEVGRLEVPEAIPSRYRGAFEEAIETCSGAYAAKASAFRSMAGVLDGNTRPSAVAAAQQNAERAQAGVMLCGLGFMKAANEAGLDLEEVLRD